jgi:hypothetical protein
MAAPTCVQNGTSESIRVRAHHHTRENQTFKEPPVSVFDLHDATRIGHECYPHQSMGLHLQGDAASDTPYVASRKQLHGCSRASKDICSSNAVLKSLYPAAVEVATKLPHARSLSVSHSGRVFTFSHSS